MKSLTTALSHIKKMLSDGTFKGTSGPVVAVSYIISAKRLVGRATGLRLIVVPVAP